jgi:hypothetical protein
MAFNPSPSAWLGPGYSLDSNEIKFTTADASSDVALPELTDVEAHPTTGDIRSVVHGICEAIADAWAATPQADRPVRMTINRSAVLDNSTGNLTYTYGISLVTTPAVEVADEPS